MNNIKVWGKIFFSFKGRIDRLTYWIMYVVPTFIFIVVSQSILLNLVANNQAANPFVAGPILIIFIWVSLAMQIKRWHDSGRSGFFVILNFIPIIGQIVFIANGIFPSDEKVNRYGDSPL